MLQTNSKRFKENEIEIFDQQPTSMMITSRKLFRTIFGRMRQIKGFGSLSNVLFTPSLIASFTPEAIDLLLQVYTWYNPLYVPTLNWLEQRGLVDSYHSFRTALEASSPWETETSHLRNSKFSQHIGKQHLVDSPTSSSPALLFRNTSCYQDELIETEDESCGCYLHFRPLRYVDRLASDWPQRHERFEVEFGLVIHQEVTILTRMKATLHLALLDFKILKNTQGYTIFEKRFKTEKFYIYTGFNQHLEIRLRFLAKGISTINLANSIFINLLEILKDSNIPIHNENSYALCCHCLQQGIEPGIIPLMDIQKEFGKGFIVLSCGHKVNSIVCLPYYMKQHIESVTLQNTKSFQYEDVKIESEIGVGSAAKVVKCRVDDTTSAMKIYSDSFQDLFHNEHSGEGVMQVFADLMNEVVTEIEIMCTCQSPNIIQLFGVCFEPTALVVEYCENGSLFDFIHSGEWLTWGMRIRFSIGIANAISALHENNYVHRDLKSPNILLKTVNGELVCVLTDFGCSGKEGSNITSIVENPSWLAPEIIRQEGNFTKAADIYSYGIILWELVSREQPYGDVKFFTEIKEKVVNGIRPKKVRIDYKQYGMLLDRCLDEKMEFRPTIKEVLELLHSITIKEEIN
ncbi:Protein kinase domain-containing protein [Entamoeba marina]